MRREMIVPHLPGSLRGDDSHRPWALPDRPWLMRQTWSALLFAHWPVEAAALGRVVPAQLPLDRFDSKVWIGVTPFTVSGLRLRGTPTLPYLSRFGELNVRTYVTVGGKPGIYFFSLDAARLAAVLAARRGYRLPYFHAEMHRHESGAATDHRSRRVSADGPPACLRVAYEPTGSAFRAAPGTLEHFLTERYCLYTLDSSGRVLRADIHHPPWPLQAARAEFAENTMGRQVGIELPEAPLLHFSERQEVVIWKLAPV